MRPICGSPLLLGLVLAISSSKAEQTTVNAIHASDSKALCTTDQRLYADRSGTPIWLDTDSLLKRATHCRPPKMPPLSRSLSVDGYVSLDFLVNDKGEVWCVLLNHGHPLFASSALSAAKDWTFRPTKQDGKAVWFYGHLRFHFSTGYIQKDENPCTVARW